MQCIYKACKGWEILFQSRDFLSLRCLILNWDWNLQRSQSSNDTSVGSFENLSLHEKKVEVSEYYQNFFAVIKSRNSCWQLSCFVFTFWENEYHYFLFSRVFIEKKQIPRTTHANVYVLVYTLQASAQQSGTLSVAWETSSQMLKTVSCDFFLWSSNIIRNYGCFVKTILLWQYWLFCHNVIFWICCHKQKYC